MQKFIISLLCALSVCLRADKNVDEFTGMQGGANSRTTVGNFLKLIKVMKEYLTDPQIMYRSLCVLRQVFSPNTESYAKLYMSLEKEHILKFLGRILIAHAECDKRIEDQGPTLGMQILQMTIFCYKQVLSDGKAHNNQNECQVAYEEALKQFRSFGKDINTKIDKLKIQLSDYWTQEEGEGDADLANAVYYESKYFADDIRILTFTKIDEDYIVSTLRPMQQINKKWRNKWRQLRKNNANERIPENVDGDISVVKSDEEEASQSSSDSEHDLAEGEKNNLRTEKASEKPSIVDDSKNGENANDNNTIENNEDVFSETVKDNPNQSSPNKIESQMFGSSRKRVNNIDLD